MSDLSERELRAAFRQSQPDSSILRRLGIVPPKVREPKGDADSAGRYRIGEEIARGGVGVVFRGHDIDLGRDVAMKVLREEYRDDAAVTARFVEEAQIGGQLQHPGVAPVYEFGLDERDRPYFAMKLIKGHTLAELLESAGERRLTHLSVFEKVCQTMAYAHARGVVHRDLKPANVMVGAFGEVQVVDWGFAKVISQAELEDEKRARNLSVIATPRSGDSSDSEAGSIFGTPAYMPPEQALGQLELIDERSDVFALGAILYEMLTGSPPYTGDDRLLRAARGDVDMTPLDAHPPALAELTRACLAAIPGDRPRNAEIVADRVAEYVAAEEERAQETRVERERTRILAQSEHKKRRLTRAVVACVLAAGGVGALAWTVSDQAEERSRAANDRSARLALAEANHLWGRGEAIGAYAALRRSRAILDSPRAAGLEAELRVAAAAEEARLRREALDRELSTKLTDVVDGWQSEWARQRLAGPLSRAFAEAELDPFSEDGRRYMQSLPQETRELWASALTVWAMYSQDENGEQATALLDAANQVDPDEWRVTLRGVAGDKNVAEIRRISAEIQERTSAIDFVLMVHVHERFRMRTRAVEVAQEGLDRCPDSLRLLVSAATRGNWDRRRPLLLAAHARAPDDVGVTSRVVQQFLNKEPETGLAIADSAIKRLGPKPDLLRARARALSKVGRHEEALAIIRAHPDEAAYRALEGSLMAAAGASQQELLDVHRRTVEDFPEMGQGWWDLARAERAAGNAAEARRVALRGLEVHPGQITLRRELVFADVELENWDSVIETIESMKEHEWTRPGHAALALAYWSKGNEREAKQLAKRMARRLQEPNPHPLVVRVLKVVLGQ